MNSAHLCIDGKSKKDIARNCPLCSGHLTVKKYLEPLTISLGDLIIRQQPMTNTKGE